MRVALACRVNSEAGDGWLGFSYEKKRNYINEVRISLLL